MKRNRASCAAPSGTASVRAESLEPRLLFAAELVKDLNTGAAPGAAMGPYYPLGDDRVVFRANDPVHGSEWWATDGTEAGTVLLADIFPGPESSAPRYSNLVRAVATVGDTLFFAADDGASGIELWKTDGTPQGTVRVKDISAGAGASRPDMFSVMGDTLYFAASDPAHGTELWKSDGTDAGTLLVADMVSGPIESRPVPLAPVGGRMLFAAGSPALGSELYSTDGTQAGTVLVKDINPGGPASNPGYELAIASFPLTWFSDFGLARDVLYFAAQDPAHGRELWKTDGTAAGTVLAADATPGTAGSAPRRINATSGGVYFVAGTAQSGARSLYRVTDDPAAPALVARLGQEPALAVLDDVLYLSGSALGAASGLHKVEAAPDRLVLLRSMPSVSAQPLETWIVAAGGHAYFPTVSSLWTTDGTPLGTKIVPLPTSPRPGIAAAGGAIYFSTDNRSLWKSDGTAEGTGPVRQINTATASSSPGPITWLDGRGLFAAEEPGATRRVWVTDGTPGGTTLIAGPDFPGGLMVPASPEYGPVTQVGPALGGRVYFWADTAATGIELWSSDGTVEGTSLVADINPGPGDAAYSNGGLNIVPAGGRLFFAADDGTHGREVWTTDGTAAGTLMPKDVDPPDRFTGPSNLTAVGDTLYFFTYDGPSDRALWNSDGTPEGTVLVKRLTPRPFAGGPSAPVAFRGQLYFAIETVDEGRRVWRSDGTEVGTVPLKELAAPGESILGPDDLTVAGDKLFFRVASNNNPLWVTDGTDAGTHPVGDLPGVNLQAAGRMTGLGDRLVFFTWYYQAATAEMWTTDGTPEGTALLKTFAARPGGNVDPTPLGVFDGRLYFRVNTADAGAELWSTDGTPGGTAMEYDVWPGPGSGRPDGLSVHDGRLYFAADDGPHGSELWSAPLPPRVVGRHVFYNNSRFDGADTGAGPADDGAVAPDKRPLLPGETASFANVTTYGRGINGVMVDLANLPPGPGPSAADFLLSVADPGAAGTSVSLAPALVSVRRGAGTGGSDRVTLIFADSAVRDAWLRVTVLAGAATGLATPDVFSFGNLVGDSGDGDAAPFRVNALDIAAAKRALNTDSPLAGRFDFNRDGRVNALDLSAVRSNLNRMVDAGADTAPLQLLAPAAIAPYPAAAPTLRVWDESPPPLLA